MGALLSCFKPNSKDSSQNTTQAITAPQPKLGSPRQPAVREGLADEHLASVPPSTTSQTQTQARAEGVDGESKAVQKVAVEAPVPIATAPTDSTPQATVTNDNMSTDDGYMSFLDKANQDPGQGVAEGQAGGKVELKAVDGGLEVPGAISSVLGKGESFYMSDADEPFVGVALTIGKGEGLPDEATFAKLVQHPEADKAHVQIMDIGEWDPQGQYKDVVDATREAAKGGDVRVYRIAREGARAEYWVVGVEGDKLVGVKALAVES